MQTQTLNHGLRQAPPSGSHSIHLVTAEMNGPGGIAYHYVTFSDHTGEDKVMMNGLALKRQNSDVRALRGVMAPPNQGGLPDSHFEEVSRIEIFRGDVTTYLRKMAMAVEALHFINAQNLNYRPEDKNSDSPNSIAHTLIIAMGLELPEAAGHYWAPGLDHIILPKNWRSKYGH